MKEHYYLFLGTVAEPLINKPESKTEDGNEEITVLYCFEKEIDYTDGTLERDEENGLLEFFLLVLLKTDLNQDAAFCLVQDDWKEIAGGSLKLELITKDKRKFRKKFLQEFAEIEKDITVFKLPCVGFYKNSLETKRSARQLRLKSVLKYRWQFWM